MEKICLTGDKWKLNLTDGDILRSRIALVQGSANFSGTSNLYDYQLDWRISNETTGENFPVELRVSEGQIQLKSLVALQLGANSLRLHESGADQLTIITWKISRSNIDNKRRFVRPVYLVNSEMVGPSKVEENLKRIDLAVELLQTALTSCIQQRFGVSKTFRIESNSHHQPICRVLNCPRLISMSALDFYWSIVTRLCKHTWKNDCGKSSEMKFLVFVDPSVFNMAECNFGTGDVAIVGANCLDVWPVRLQDIQSRFRDNSEHINCPLER